MKTKTVTYSRTINLGNYNSAKLEVTLELEDAEKAEDAVENLRNFVKRELSKELDKDDGKQRLFD